MQSPESLSGPVIVCAACLDKDKKYDLLEERYFLLEAQLKEFESRCEKLEYQLSQLSRYRFGQKSEKFSSVTKPSSFASSEKKNLNGRKPLPDHLDREIIEYTLPKASQSCGVCHHDLVKIGEEVSEQLHHIRPHLRVRRHVQAKYGCAHCGETLLVAEKPEQPIAKGLATSELLSHILVSKYQDHLPLHRQEQIFAREGIDLVRSTLCDWVKECAKLLSVIVEEMKKDLLKKSRVHSDDTPVPVQVSGKKGKTHQGRLWVYIGCEEKQPTVVIYDYTPTRSQSGPMNFLGNYEGFLQADAYCGYDRLFVEKALIEVACWAHARRKFYEVACATVSEKANMALDFIGGLYEVEKEAKLLSVEERKNLRQLKSKPILENFKGWLEKSKEEVLPKSPLGGAIQYTLKLWAALTIYLKYGFLEIDNNRSERAMKVVVLGRKNWIFGVLPATMCDIN